MTNITKKMLWFYTVAAFLKIGGIFFFFAEYPEFESGYNAPRETIPYLRVVFGPSLSEEDSKSIGLALMGTGLAIVVATFYIVGFIEQYKEEERKAKSWERFSLSNSLKRKREREASSKKKVRVESEEITND